MSHASLYKNRVRELRMDNKAKFKDEVRANRRKSRQTLTAQNRNIDIMEVLSEGECDAEKTIPETPQHSVSATPKPTKGNSRIHGASEMQLQLTKSKGAGNLERLRKWKAEKAARKALEAKKKKPVFKLGMKVNPGPTIFLHSEKFLNNIELNDKKQEQKSYEFKPNLPSKLIAASAKFMANLIRPFTRSQVHNAVFKTPSAKPEVTVPAGKKLKSWNNHKKSSKSQVQKENLLHSPTAVPPVNIRQSAILRGANLIDFESP